jgi:succinyl-CoA synthetase beta subunit
LPQVTESTDFNELAEKESWLSSTKLVVKPDMLFGKRGKSGLVALNLDLAQVAAFVKERLGKEVPTFTLFFYLSFLHSMILLLYTVFHCFEQHFI